MQTMREQMNKTGLMMGPMMGIIQGMTISCMVIGPIMMGNQTKMGDSLYDGNDADVDGGGDDGMDNK